MAQIPAWFVVAIGVGTVFFGLACIVLICSVLGFFMSKAKNDEPISRPDPADPAKQQELIAVMSAAIAASSHRDPACIKIISVKKVK